MANSFLGTGIQPQGNFLNQQFGQQAFSNRSGGGQGQSVQADDIVGKIMQALMAAAQNSPSAKKEEEKKDGPKYKSFSEGLAEGIQKGRTDPSYTQGLFGKGSQSMPQSSGGYDPWLGATSGGAWSDASSMWM